MIFGRNGSRGVGRRRTRLSGAVITAAALGALMLTAGCAAIGTDGSSGAGVAGASAASAAASVAAGSAAKGSAVVTLTPTPGVRSIKPTLARMPSATPSASSASSASPAPAASVPPPSGAAGPYRLVTFVNRMSQTIWVAAAPNAATPLAATGWVLPAGQSVTITTPSNLNTRFWGRTGCVFNSAGVGHCQTGDCGGLFQCKGWGTIPATLAEVNFDAWDSLDFYDVSMVDGSNLPMYINTTSSSGGTVDPISSDGCVPAGCTKPVVCPSILDVKVGSTVVGCISACARLDTDQLCCRGQYSSRAACNPTTWPVDYAAVFKRAEPYAYSYVDDDATSVFTCKGVCDYRITFGITP